MMYNVTILTNCIAALNDNNSDKIEKTNILNIKKATRVVLASSKIIDNSICNREIANSIENEFIQFVNRQTDMLQSLKCQLE